LTGTEIPGFVDLQVNGWRGVDFSSPDLQEEAFVRVCRELADEGTVAFLPTLITAPLELYERNLPLMAGLMERTEIGNHALGFHLEGPFISAEEGARGMHRAEYIRHPDVSLIDHLQRIARGRIRMITMAAELPAAAEAAHHAAKLGIIVSLGHHLADEQAVSRLADAGARALTHLGNGVPEQLHRHHNPIWAGLAVEGLSAMIVADGHHLPESLLRIILKIKGISRTIVVSDASPLAGLAPGAYEWGGISAVLEQDGLLRQSRGPYLAGSSATLLQCMNHLASLGMLAPDELLRLGHANPLLLIGAHLPRPVGNVAVRFNREKGRFILMR
jgi:N-acetylglucosamine-6-phosphate deacetylase